MESLVRWIGPSGQSGLENPGVIGRFTRNRLRFTEGQQFDAFQPGHVAKQRAAWEANIRTAELLKASIDKAARDEERLRAKGVRLEGGG